MKKWIGLVPKYKVGDPEKTCMDDYILVGHTYAQRITEAGCTPVGLVPVNGWLTEDALQACDGFLVQGGPEFHPYHFQVIQGGKHLLNKTIHQQFQSHNYQP